MRNAPKRLKLQLKQDIGLLILHKDNGNKEFAGQRIKNSGIDRKELFITTQLRFRNPDRMKENLIVFDFELTNDEIEKLKTMDTNTLLIGSSQNYKIAEMCVNLG